MLYLLQNIYQHFNHTNWIIYNSSKYQIRSSTLQTFQNLKIEESTVTQLSTMFNNYSIKESNIAEENTFKGIQQLAAQITTISDDYTDDHIGENPIEDVCSSIEDLDVIIMKTENLRTQYRSENGNLSRKSRKRNR